MSNIGITVARASVVAAQLSLDPRNADCRALLRDLLAEAEAELARLELLDVARVDIRYLSPCPPGYDTVLGYLAKHNPGMLDLLDKSPDATIDDGIRLRSKALSMNLATIRVEASPWLKEFGVQKVHAYPIRLLAEHFGV